MTVTKEMIEAAAKAMCEEDGFLWNARSCMETGNGEEPEEQREYWLDKAETALTAALSAQPAPAVAVPDGWRPISEADREITHQQHFPDIDLTIRNSDRYWVRDADGRVYEASWTEDGKGRDYWWDWDGESPVDPIEFMPHPLDPRFAAAPVSVAACRMCGGKGWHAGDPEGAAIEECSECNGGTSTPVAVPAGWKLVPVEPTAEMITGACRATVLGEDEDSEPVYLEPREALSAYSAMLAAAPQPPMPEVNGLTEAQLLARVAAVICEETCGLTSECKSREAASALLKNGYLATPPADLREENERLRQDGRTKELALGNLIDIWKLRADAAEARVKALEEENERARAQLNMATDELTDVVSILSCVDGFRPTVDRLNATIRAIEQRAALKGGE